MNRYILQQQFTPEHVFSYLTQGTLTVITSTQTWRIQAGEYLLYTRNHLAKYPPGTTDEVKAITLVLQQDILQQYAKEHQIMASQPQTGSTIITITPNVLLRYFIQHLPTGPDAPYPAQADYPEAKIKELLFLLLRTDTSLQNILFNFNKPARSDLRTFMQQHFRFNTSIKHFSYLSGRSLTVFKRDFAALFGQSPGRWLLQQRLAEAHHLITSENQKPSDVYWYVGFEDLSHFSYAFKKKYGISPSQARKENGHQ